MGALPRNIMGYAEIAEAAPRMTYFFGQFSGQHLFSKVIRCGFGNLSSAEIPVVIDLLKKSFHGFSWCKICRGVFRTLSNIYDGAFVNVF